MINIKISVHPFGRKLEWRGWGGYFGRRAETTDRG